MNANVLTLFLQSLSALAVVLALFAGLVWLLRRMQSRLPATPGDNQQLRVIGRCAIDARHSVVELEAGGRRWLVGVSQNQLTALGRYAPPGDTATDSAVTDTVKPPCPD